MNHITKDLISVFKIFLGMDLDDDERKLIEQTIMKLERLHEKR